MDSNLLSENIVRLESKVDKLTDAVMRLVLIEERQTAQGERLGNAEQKIAVNEMTISRVDNKVERWINRGIGAWAIAVVLFAIIQFGAKAFSK
jgi:hypothetical protein